MPDAVVNLGNRVTVHFVGDTHPETYLILDRSKAVRDEAGDITSLSSDSPIAQALLGHKVGDTVSFSTGAAPVKIEIIACEPA